MKQDIFTKLPPEIIINILLKLPFRTIVSCKCICKPLLKLVESREFGVAYLSESALLLTVLEKNSWLNKIYEIKDVLNVQYHDLDFHLLTKFQVLCCDGEFILRFHGGVRGSADGLLLLVDISEFKVVYICNPITRDYLQPRYSQELDPRTCVVTYGFGASKLTGQYKVVRNCREMLDLNAKYTLLEQDRGEELILDRHGEELNAAYSIATTVGHF